VDAGSIRRVIGSDGGEEPADVELPRPPFRLLDGPKLDSHELDENSDYPAQFTGEQMPGLGLVLGLFEREHIWTGATIQEGFPLDILDRALLLSLIYRGLGVEPERDHV